MNQNKLAETRSRPATIKLSTRTDARYLATAVLFYHSNNTTPKSISELVRLSFESFVQFLIQTDKVSFVQTHEDAFQILENSGLKPDSINPKNLVQALLNEGHDISDLTSSPIDLSHRHTVKNTPVSSSDPKFKQAQDKLAETLNKTPGEFEEEENIKLQNFKDNILNPNLKPEEDSE